MAESKTPREIDLAEKVTVQFRFSKASLQKLDDLVTYRNAKTRAQIIREAVAVYAKVLEENQQGRTLGFKSDDGTFAPLWMILS